MRQLSLTYGREDEDSGRWAGGPEGGAGGGSRPEADPGGPGGGTGGERLRRRVVLGPDSRGPWREQAGRPQEARQADQGQVPGGADGKEGEGRMIFNRFAKEARACVEAADEEARALGHDSLGDEDFLLGILRADEGLAAEALSSLGVKLEGAREESERMASDALSSVGIILEDIRAQAGDAFDWRIPGGRRIPFSPRGKKGLERALKEAGGAT